MSSRFIHVFTNGSISFFFKAEWFSIMYVPRFPYPSIHWWTLVCFHVLAIVNNIYDIYFSMWVCHWKDLKMFYWIIGMPLKVCVLRCTEQTFVLCGRRRGWDVSREHVYYLGWNRSPAQAGCARQVLGPGALGRPRGIGWRGRWEGGLGWGIHVTPWLIHVNAWQKPLQYCKVISLQLIKINEKNKLKKSMCPIN